jgi:hypothetical protein
LRGSNSSSAAKTAGSRRNGATRRHGTVAATKAQYGYDYAGQGPINGYDLDGTVMAALDSSSCRPWGPCLIPPHDRPHLPDLSIDVNITAAVGVGITGGFQIGTGGARGYVGTFTGAGLGISANIAHARVADPGFHTTIGASGCMALVCGALATDVTHGKKANTTATWSGGVGWKYSVGQADVWIFGKNRR